MQIQLPYLQRMQFNQQVWEIARRIPPGRVFTYGEIAQLLSLPEGIPFDQFMAFRARWVGAAMAACPADVPWQRVINAQGMISQRPGAEDQRRLLEAEGVKFDERGRVDLKKYGWEGPEESNPPRLF